MAKSTLQFLIATVFTCTLLSCRVNVYESAFEEGTTSGEGGANGPILPARTIYVKCGSYGSTNEITIPPGTAACQDAYEYSAHILGCNQVDKFADAYGRMCRDCGKECEAAEYYGAM